MIFDDDNEVRRAALAAIKESRGGKLVTLLLLGILVLLAAVYALLYGLAGDRMPRGVTIEGVKVGGLHPAAAESKLRTRARPAQLRPDRAHPRGRQADPDSRGGRPLGRLPGIGGGGRRQAQPEPRPALGLLHRRRQARSRARRRRGQDRRRGHLAVEGVRPARRRGHHPFRRRHPEGRLLQARHRPRPGPRAQGDRGPVPAQRQPRGAAHQGRPLHQRRRRRPGDDQLRQARDVGTGDVEARRPGGRRPAEAVRQGALDDPERPRAPGRRERRRSCSRSSSP